MSEPQQNWARNFTYAAARWHYPKSLEQVQELVVRSRKVKALGTRHSFNNIADTAEDIISLDHFDRVVALDHARCTVTVEAGMRYGQLSRYLHSEGFALHNLASLPHRRVHHGNAWLGREAWEFGDGRIGIGNRHCQRRSYKSNARAQWR